MRPYFLIFVITLYLFGIQSCKRQSQSSANDEPATDRLLKTETITVKSNPTVVSLLSYGLSDYCHNNRCIYSYNYKEHAIDILDLKTDTVSRSISLESEGPNAVMRELHGLQVYSPDTIVTYDFVAIKIIDSVGNVISKIELPVNGFSRIDCNVRSNISDFKIDMDNHTILYPIKQPGKNEIIEYDFAEKNVVNHIALKNPIHEGYYGFMDYPNVSFYKDCIIYNYPFEANVYIYDRKSDSTRMISPKSKFTDNRIKEYDGKSVEELSWYGASNCFYSPLYLIPGKDCFVRITLGETSLDKSDNIDKAYYDRPIYVMTFDNEFKVIDEFEIERNRYNTFAGWCPLYDRIAFFQENACDPQNDNDIVIDMILID